jgi:hypothetical protein
METEFYNPNKVASQSSAGGYGSYKGYGSNDLSEVDGLLELARSRGGNIAAAAEELVHPQKSMLATMSEKFKNGFSEFVDIISTPNQIVAGALSSKYTVREAIKQNISTSDVIFGDRDPNASTMKKVGSFTVRTATDILLDPLTYLTFGGSVGVLGLKGATKLSVAAEVGKIVGKKAAPLMDVVDVGLSAGANSGQEVLNAIKATERKWSLQKNGATATQIAAAEQAAIKTAGKLSGKSAEAFEMTKAELDDLMKETLDAKLVGDYSKKAMSNMLKKNPALAETLLDSGGIKYFGKSIISARRIAGTMEMIPYMTQISHFTSPIRMALAAPFDTSVIKLGKVYTRMPQEFLDIENAARDLARTMKDDRILKLANIVEANQLTAEEGKLLLAHIEAGTSAIDPRLATAQKHLMDYTDDEFKFLKESGINFAKLDNHVPHILLKEDVDMLFSSRPPKQTVEAGMERGVKVFTDAINKRTMIGTGKYLKLVEKKVEVAEGAAPLSDEAIAEARQFEDELGTIWEAGKASVADARSVGIMFDDNVITAHAARSYANINSGTARRFMRDVASSMGTTDARPGYVRINLSGIKAEADKLKELHELESLPIYFHPAVAKRIEEFVGASLGDQATSDIMKAYDKVQNFWKASVTSIFPAFHVRNALSNVFMHMQDLGLNSLSPANHAFSAEMIVNDRRLVGLEKKMMGTDPGATKAAEQMQELLNKPAFTDSTGMPWTVGELRQVMKEKGIAFRADITGSLDTADNTPSDAFSKLLFPTKFSKTAGKANVFAKGREVGRAIEEQGRILSFVANLKNTGDVMLAANRTKMFLFDYQNLTAFERNYLKRLLPFYTFTRKNLELQYRALTQTPGYVAAEVKGLQNLGDAISGGEMSEEEKNALPSWIKTGINFLVKRNGETVNILGSLGTPLEAPFAQFQPNVLLGSISPVLRLPVEQMSGYSFFQGKALSDVTNASAFKRAPKVIQDFIGYTEVTGKRSDGSKFSHAVALRPERMNFVLQLPPTSRVLSAMRQMENQDLDTQLKVWQQLTGIRPYSFDLEQEAARREKELRVKLEDLLTDAKVTAQYKRVFIPKEKTGF